MTRPLIGVTKPSLGAWEQNFAIRLGLWISGAKSVNITPQKPIDLENIDGLLISGGTDVHPKLFDISKIKENYNYDEPRDEMEVSLYHQAKQKNIPLLGICRGAQLMNICEGGSLYTNISREFENAKYPNHFLAKVFFRKKIEILSDSKIFQAFQKKTTKVNSMHTQSINKVGEKLRVTSKEPNGLIQSIENSQFSFFVGVQFHPEFLIYRRDVRRLFSQFVEKCKGSKRFNT